MSPEEEHARSVFLKAVELKTPEERRRFLDEQCADNPFLRAEVEDLLLHEGQIEGFLEPGSRRDGPAAATEDASANLGDARGMPSDESREKPGEIIGRYKLLQQIGEGGFGVVYMAEQEKPVKRRVAIKVIKAGMDSKGVIARFEAERQALAMMDHPNIARVLDAGETDAGRPYFVMELVKGIPITEYCDQAKLGTVQRLNLFIDVCNAVQHAHQKGVIHRDLKPSNIMITLRDDKPNVKVIDFGIAKATEQRLTEKTLFTAYGQMIGTPVYMSPEQAAMSEFDVDTRSDIYSLGVLLYELLTGSPPFDAQTLRKAGFDEMRRIIREQTPQKPSTRLSTLAEAQKLTVSERRRSSPQALSRQLHGDLDWIILKALEKDRARRYESASAFAQDIGRHLAAQPVLAAAPSAGYRLRKFMQRNKASMLVAATIVLLLLGGTVLSTWQAIRATHANTNAVAAVVEKGKALDAANTANEQAQKRLSQIEKTNEILGSIFENLDPNEIAKSERPLQAILVEKLDQAVEQLQGEAIGDPLIVATMQTRLGRSLLALGAFDKAIVLFKQARATLETNLGPDDPYTLTSRYDLARAYVASGQIDLALPLADQTLKLMQARLGPTNPYTLLCMDTLAQAYQAGGKLDLALPLYEQTLKLNKERFGDESTHTLTSMNNLATAYMDASKPEKALPLLKVIFEIRETKFGADFPETLTCMNNLAAAYESTGERNLSLPLFEKTLKLRTAKLGPDHPQTLMSMNVLAWAYIDAGKLDLALPLAEESFKLNKAKLGVNHPQTLKSMHNLAMAYSETGHPELAVPLAEEMVKLTKAKLGANHPDTLAGMALLALAYQNSGRPELARPLFERVIPLMKSVLGPDASNRLKCMTNLATAYAQTGQPELALPLAKETLELTRAKLGPQDRDTLRVMHNLAYVYWSAKQLDQSIPLFEQTLKLQQEVLGRQHPDTLMTLGNLGFNYMDAGRLDRAIPVLEEALKLRRATFGPEHPGTQSSVNALAMAYQKAGKLDLACPLFEEELKYQEETLGREHPITLGTVAVLGADYKELGRIDQALPLLEEAHQASKKYPALRWVDAHLLGAYIAAGKNKEAVSLGKEMLPEVRAAFAAESPQLADALAPVAHALLRTGAFNDAQPLLQECLAIRQKTQPNAWTTFNTESMLGEALLRQKNFKESEPLLLGGYEGMQLREKTIPPTYRRRLEEALERLISFYESRGQDHDMENASKYRERLKQNKAAGQENEKALK